MFKKNISIILFLIIFIFSFIILISSQIYDSRPQKIKKRSVKQVTDELDLLLSKKLVNENLTMGNLKKILGYPISNNMFFLGKDSFIAEGINPTISSRYHLEKYEKRQREYVNHIKKAFEEKYQYEIVDKEKSEEYIYEHIRINTIYYGLYSTCLEDLISYGLEQKNIGIDERKLSDKEQAESYKLKVLAMKVLDDDLNVYKNLDNETVDVTIIYKNGEPQNKDELFSLLCNINGLTYPNMDFSNKDNLKIYEARLDEYKLKLDQII